MSASVRWRMTAISAWGGCSASTVLVWAGPAQIILITTLGSGATAVQAVDCRRPSAPSGCFRWWCRCCRTMRTHQARSVVISCSRRISLPSRCGSSATGCCRWCLASGASRSRTGSAADFLFGLSGRDHGRVRPGCQPAAAVCGRDPDADAAGVPAFHRAQLPADF